MALAPALLDQLNQVRAVEGATLAAELRAEMMRLRALAEECAELRTGAREAHYERLRTRIGELLKADEAAAAQATEIAVAGRGCAAGGAVGHRGGAGSAARAHRELS